MITTPDQVTSAQRQAFESMVNFTNSALDYAEKIANLHLSFVKESSEAGAEQGKKLMSVKDVQELLQTQSNAFQPHFERVINYSKNLMEISSEAQEEMSRSIESQMTEMNRVVMEALDRAAKNGPAGSEAAIAAVKSVLTASSSAYDSLNKAAKKVAEIAATNITTATQVGVKAASAAAAAPAPSKKK